MWDEPGTIGGVGEAKHKCCVRDFPVEINAQE